LEKEKAGKSKAIQKNIMKKNITFTLPAEAVQGATEAFLLGDFNDWNPENAPKLEKQPDGSFKTAAQLEEGKTYQYRFLLNDGRWVNDYHAQNYVPVSGLYVDNCVITVPESESKSGNKKAAGKPAPANTKVVKADTAKNQGSGKTKTVKKAASKTKAVKGEASKAKKAKSAEGKSTLEQ
jgi:1,4-alpha-glucan branching enzyme